MFVFFITKTGEKPDFDFILWVKEGCPALFFGHRGWRTRLEYERITLKSLLLYLIMGQGGLKKTFEQYGRHKIYYNNKGEAEKDA